jgi:hypothetical protein
LQKGVIIHTHTHTHTHKLGMNFKLRTCVDIVDFRIRDTHGCRAVRSWWSWISSSLNSWRDKSDNVFIKIYTETNLAYCRYIFRSRESTPWPAYLSVANKVTIFAMMNTVRIRYLLLIFLNRLLRVFTLFIESEAQVCHHCKQRQGLGK